MEVIYLDSSILTIATHDRTMTSVAHQLGLGTVDPVTPGNPPQG